MNKSYFSNEKPGFCKLNPGYVPYRRRRMNEVKNEASERSEAERLQRVVMRYTHDCERCIPLGQFQENDIYYCDQNGFPTLIARYGNSGADYTSGIHTLLLPELIVAHAMAEAAGLISA